MRYALLVLAVLIGGCVRTVVEPEPGPAPEPPPAIDEAAPPSATLGVGHVTREHDYCVYDPATGVSTKLFENMDTQIAYSDDAASMAYQRRDGNIYLADTRTGESREIGKADRTTMFTIAISPDGASAAWVSADKITISRDGETVVIDGPEHPASPSWSPDGTKLAVGAWAEYESEDDGLWLCSGEGPAEQLVPPAEGWGSVGRIQWSPDGKWLAWERGAGDGWTGDLARSDGSDLRRDEIGGGPRAWLPDSSALIVDVHVEAGASSTGLYTLADRKLVPLGPADAHTVSCMSPDGSEAVVFGPGKEARFIKLAAPDMAARWETPGYVEACAWGANDMIVFAASVSVEEGMRIFTGPPMGPVEDTGVQPSLPVAGLRWIATQP